ncbi:MAG: O-antigen ligase family protein [Prolixibacteraceae bacterium]|nr:O-antigen ligase family protein [Prolixibacteraceae bacterium]
MRDRKGQIIHFVNNYLPFFSIAVLLFSLPFSESGLSIFTGVLFLLVAFTGNFNDKVSLIRNDKSFWALSGIFFIYLFGCIFCNDISTGLYELKKNIFWFLIPAGFAFIPKIDEKKVWYLLCLFVSFVTAATVITTIKIIFSESFNLSDVRDASYVSHIAFSLQIVFSIFILIVSVVLKFPVLGKINKWLIALWCLWLLVFLGFQKSLIGGVSLYFAGIYFLFWMSRTVRSQFLKRIKWPMLLFFVFLPILYVGWVACNFYIVKDNESDFSKTTLSGNKYSFKENDNQLENGYHVNWYICNKELEKEWNLRSCEKIYDKDATGYPIYDTLIRYMTSKGLRKDSAGVAALTDADIKNVRAGISNIIFVKKKYSIYPRIYQTIWEVDRYYHTGNPNNQSLSQRIEFSKAAWHIIKNNFWGIGTGNYPVFFDKAYVQINTQLKEGFRSKVHNQYLSYMVKFGLPGFIVIILLIFFSIKWKKQYNNIFVIMLLIIVGISNFGDTTLEMHVGLPFFLVFLSLFLWHSPALLSNSIQRHQGKNKG